MDDPVTCGFLSNPFLHERLLAAEELHGQFVVRRLEQGLKLILQEALFNLLTRQTRTRLLLRGPIERHIVHPEVNLSAALVIHLVACNTTTHVRKRSTPIDIGTFVECVTHNPIFYCRPVVLVKSILHVPVDSNNRK